MFRIDSAYYSAARAEPIRRGGGCFSVTVRMDPKIRAAIAAIGEAAWTPITYPRAIWDEDQQRLISDAEVAEVPYTAFASKKGQAITARLIVRRVRDLNRKAAAGQDELFAIWRYHALFTDSLFVTSFQPVFWCLCSAAAGVVCFSCAVNVLPREQCLGAGETRVPLLCAAFRTKWLLRERYLGYMSTPQTSWSGAA